MRLSIILHGFIPCSLLCCFSQLSTLIHSNDEKEDIRMWWFMVWSIIFDMKKRRHQWDPPPWVSFLHSHFSSTSFLSNDSHRRRHHHQSIQCWRDLTWKSSSSLRTRDVFILTKASFSYRLCNHSCKYYIYIIINTPFKENLLKAKGVLNAYEASIFFLQEIPAKYIYIYCLYNSQSLYLVI